MKTLSNFIIFLLLAKFKVILGEESIYYLYLNGSSALKLEDKVVRDVFSKVDSDLFINFVIFIESGQLPKVVVFELKDICTEKSLLRLSIDSNDPEGEKDPRLTLSVKDEGKITSETELKDNVESSVRIELSNTKVELSVDGAAVGQLSGKVNKEPVFSITIKFSVHPIIFVDNHSLSEILCWGQ